MTRILLVCMANVCRSPMALAVAKQRVGMLGLGKVLDFDSAGTHARRAGERPDPRAVSVLSNRSYTLGKTRSRQVTTQDFERFDLIVAMDESNLVALTSMCPPPHRGKLHLLLEFAPELGLQDVPDPYYGNLAGFERVLALCETGVQGLIKAQMQAL
jgi:protein-tyrosine phosphatase